MQYIAAKQLKPKPLAPVAAPKPSPAKPAAPAQAVPAAVPGTPFTDVPLSNMRKTIAKRLTQSKVNKYNYN